MQDHGLETSDLYEAVALTTTFSGQALNKFFSGHRNIYVRDTYELAFKDRGS